METLLELAKKSVVGQKRDRSSSEEVELALAFFNHEIRANQYATVTKCPPSNAIAVAGSVIREAMKRGEIKVSIVKKK